MTDDPTPAIGPAGLRPLGPLLERRRAAEEKAAMRLMMVVGPDQRLLDLALDEVKRRTELFSRSRNESPRWAPHATPKLAALTSVTDDVVRGFLL